MQIFRTVAPIALAFAAMGSAHADVSLLNSGMYGSIVAGTNSATVGSVTLQSVGGNFIIKSQAGFSGLGVTGGRTGDEIDTDETITLSWANGLVIKNFAVAVLFNGPEYGDFAEIAQVTAYNGADKVGVGQLQVDALLNHVASFSGTGFGSASNLSLASDGLGGAWSVDNPFGNATVTRLEFTAIASGVCWPQQVCNNQSDFTLSSVSAVPEPATYALVLLGLAMTGVAARRSRSA